MRLLLPLLALLALLAPRTFAEVRLAILSEPGAQAEAALLTAELAQPPVVLLERDEIARIFAEQKLAAAGLATSQLPGVGRLLHADGVIFLTKENAALAMRIVAVNPGVVIASWREDAPAEAAPWSRAAASRIAAMLPKLSVPADAAVPVSVLELRATRARPEAAGIERELTLLLTHRLAHEPALFVLERQRMETLEREKTEAAGEPFWTGRWLLDGAIEQAITEPDQLTIRLRLQPPGAGAAVEIVRACHRTELREAAEFLAGEIARRLQREPTVEKWDAAQEAEQFWRDAQWAFRNELFARAATAAESACALGRRSAETFTLRVRAELLAARPELVVPYRYPENYQYLRDYLSDRNSHWRAQLPHTRGYRTPDVLAKIFAAMPEAERQGRLAQTQRALELFREHFDVVLAEPEQTPLAAETLTIGGAMLEWFHDNRTQWDDGMRRLAALLREADDLATRRRHEFDQRAGHTPPPLFWQSKVALTPLWATDAAQTVAVYRAALREPFDAEWGATLRDTMVHSRDLFPSLAVAGDGSRAQKLWADFIGELSASDSPADRWTGLCCQYEAAPENAREEIATRMRDDFWAERARFARHEIPFAYYELLRLPRGGREESPERAFPHRFFLYLLAESTPIEHDAFWELFRPESYSEAQAAELLAAMLAHETRVRAKLGDHWMLAVIRERSQELLLRFPKLRREMPQDGVLKIARYWHPYRLPQFRDGGLKAANVSFKEAIYRDGRLWVFVTFDGAGRGRDMEHPQFIFAIDLKTFDTEVIPFEPPPPLAVPRKDHWGGENLEISADAIFVSKDWQLSRYDRRAKTWRHFPGLPGVWEQPWLLGGRLYVRINNAPGGIQVQHFGEMVALDPQTGAPTLLVSDRRTPPESPLDAWPLSWLTARAGADGRVLFRGIAGDGSSKRRYATFDPGAMRWEPLDEAAWNRSASAGSAAHMAMASDESAWKVEGRGGGKDTLSLKRGERLIPFRCELSAEDRGLLTRNGDKPSVDVIEQNLLPGLGANPLAYETPDGIAICTVFHMPGFWFVPKGGY